MHFTPDKCERKEVLSNDRAMSNDTSFTLGVPISVYKKMFSMEAEH